ncbi:MAG: TetR/AcrR family transcriptional regulator [Vallitaleaceae bacterium]|nr:TetR/AcrR family transcriptional regulator [Vallitaleaceae bacterium]
MSQKGQETRQRIIATTLTLLHTKSLDQISVREICELAHIAKGTFYIYFEAKEAIAWAILEHSFGNLLNEFTSFTHDTPTQDSIDKILTYVFDFSIKNQEILKLIHHVRFTDFLGKEAMLAKYDTFFTEGVFVLLKNGVDAGIYRIHNVAFMAYFISSSIHELIDQVIYERSPYQLNEIKTELKGIIQKMIT